MNVDSYTKFNMCEFKFYLCYCNYVYIVIYFYECLVVCDRTIS